VQLGKGRLAKVANLRRDHLEGGTVTRYQGLPAYSFVRLQFEHDVHLMQKKSRQSLIVHGHSSLPKSAPAKIPKGFMLCSYTEPGTPIYSCQTLKVLKALESGCLLNSVSSVKEADDVRLRMNTDATPNYSISFNGSHNNYEAQTAPYSLGLWLYDSTSTPRLQPIPWSDRMNMVEAFHYATEHRINRVMIFGCKGGELAQ